MKYYYQYNDPNDAHNVTQFQNGDGAEPYVNTYNDQDQAIRQVHGNDQIDIEFRGQP